MTPRPPATGSTGRSEFVARFGLRDNVAVGRNLLVCNRMAAFDCWPLALEVAAGHGFGGAGFKIRRIEIGDNCR